MRVLLCLDTGIRIREALYLRVADVDRDNLLIKLTGKGRKDRLAPFSDDIYEDLDDLTWEKSYGGTE